MPKVKPKAMTGGAFYICHSLATQLPFQVKIFDQRRGSLRTVALLQQDPGEIQRHESVYRVLRR